MNNFFLSNSEIFILIFLNITLFLPLNLINQNFKLTLAHPLIIYSIFIFYYTVFCPVIQIAFNQTIFRNFDFREQYILGWGGALLSVISVFIGYSLKNKIKKVSKYCNLNYESLWQIGLYLNIFGIFIYLVSKGFDISVFNFFSPRSLSFDFLEYRGGFKNYLRNALDLLVSGNLLMFGASYLNKKRFPVTLISIIISTSLFLNSGFRYRILFLFLSIIIFIISKEDKLKFRTSINLGIFSIIFGLISMTIIGDIRTYGQGLNFSNLNLSTNYIIDTINAGESTLFVTTSGIINLIPETLPFENFYPIYKTIIHPFPSFVFDKNSGDYLFKIVNGVFGFKNIYQGAAYLNYGEYYLMFGWFGIFIFNFLLGYLFKRLWLWINLHKEEPLAFFIYILNVIYIFMIVSRGYLPQQLHLYIFNVLPVYSIYLFNLKNKLNNN